MAVEVCVVSEDPTDDLGRCGKAGEAQSCGRWGWRRRRSAQSHSCPRRARRNLSLRPHPGCSPETVENVKDFVVPGDEATCMTICNCSPGRPPVIPHSRLSVSPSTRTQRIRSRFRQRSRWERPGRAYSRRWSGSRRRLLRREGLPPPRQAQRKPQSQIPKGTILQKLQGSASPCVLISCFYAPCSPCTPYNRWVPGSGFLKKSHHLTGTSGEYCILRSRIFKSGARRSHTCLETPLC